MKKFAKYRCINSCVSATQLTPDTGGLIVSMLVKEIQAGVLSMLEMENDELKKTHTVTFRYKDDAIKHDLRPGMYLVVLANGRYEVMDAVEFESHYKISDGTNLPDPVVPIGMLTDPKVGTAHVGRTRLPH